MQYIKLFVYADMNMMITISWRIPRSSFMNSSRCSPSGSYWRNPSPWRNLRNCPLSDPCSSDTNSPFPRNTWSPSWRQIKLVKTIFSHNFIMNGLKIISLMEHNFWLVWERFRGHILRETVFRCMHGEIRNATWHAVGAHISLQPQVLQQRHR